ncbi:MAG: urease accessory protein UreF [Gammaproteobacteria bacterium]|nr:urease accessory protein UreF [Gammaproteobacteria bacterium]
MNPLVETAQLIRLQQLGSANLPVGAFAFSQGLESAVDSGWLKSAEEVESWLDVQLRYSIGKVDIPIYFRLHQACGDKNIASQRYWNDFLLACRETSEQRLSDTATGLALGKLLASLDVPLQAIDEPTFLTYYAMAATHWQLNAEASCSVHVWSWLENQVIAATKLMPLGQTRAQQMLCTLQEAIPQLIAAGRSLSDSELGASLPALAISSCHHETQYSRLFRS